MPSRIVREGIIDSEAVNSLSDSGEIFYRRLMSIVDDYGRFEARVSVLRTRLFGQQLERWPVARVSQALAEVSQMTVNGGRIPLVVVYEVAGKKYLEIQNFKQRVRASGSKYPDPSVRQVVDGCRADDRQETDTCAPSARATTTSPSPTTITKVIPEDAVVLQIPPLSVATSSVAPGLEEFKRRWEAGTRSTIGLSALDNAWFVHVTPDVVGAVFECLASYLASKQVADGVVARAERWFVEQSKANWGGRWPPARAAPKRQSREAKLDEVFGAENASNEEVLGS